MTIDHEYTQNIVCPHCGEEDENSWEYELGDGDAERIACGCGFEFIATCHISRTYSTYGIEGE